MWLSLYPHAAALSGLLIWYGVLAWLGPTGRGAGQGCPPETPHQTARSRWLWPLLPLALGWLSFRLLGRYLAAVHPLFAPHLQSLGSYHSLAWYVVDVGLREETLKLLLALPLLWLWHPARSRPPGSGPRHTPPALLTGAWVGLGFATVENRMFFATHSEPTLLVGRIFATTLLHTATTALCGAAWAHARGRTHAAAAAGQGRLPASLLPWGRFVLIFLSVAAAHGLYDWAPASGLSWLHSGGTSWLSLLTVIVLAAAVFHQLRRSLPAGARPRAAAAWLVGGAFLQYAFTLGLTWARWGTLEAVYLCARECALFLPVVCGTAAGLLMLSPSLPPGSGR